MKNVNAHYRRFSKSIALQFDSAEKHHIMDITVETAIAIHKALGAAITIAQEVDGAQDD